MVTIPKPDREDDPLPLADATPIPRAITRGTVTGPVVTAPQSHARPMMLFKSLLKSENIVSPIVGTSVI